MFKFFNRSSANSHVDNHIDYKALQDMRYKIMGILHDKIKEISEKEFFYINPNINLRKTDVPHLPFQVGDKIILNVYELLYQNSNSWDGGAHQISYMDKSKLQKPAIVTAAGFGIDYSLAFEMIERWIDNVDMSYEQLLKLSPAELFQKYNNRYTNKDETSAYKNKFGVYLYVKWEVTESDFCEVTRSFTDYRWITSFLKLDSEEGSITYNMWKKEIALKNEINKLKSKKEKLVKDWEDIYRVLQPKTKSHWRNYMQ